MIQCYKLADIGDNAEFGGLDTYWFEDIKGDIFGFKATCLRHLDYYPELIRLLTEQYDTLKPKVVAEYRDKRIGKWNKKTFLSYLSNAIYKYQKGFYFINDPYLTSIGITDIYGNREILKLS